MEMLSESEEKVNEMKLNESTMKSKYDGDQLNFRHALCHLYVISLTCAMEVKLCKSIRSLLQQTTGSLIQWDLRRSSRSPVRCQ